MLSVLPEALPRQIPLIHIVETDDRFLSESDVSWFRILRDLDWRPLVPVAVQYYEALWAFNQQQLLERLKRKTEAPVPNPETKEQARQRTLLERPTLDPSQPVILPVEANLREPLHVDPRTVGPGQVPARFRGRRPKDFFAMSKAFLGVVLMGRPAEPDLVHQELGNNPAFARTCGFTLPDPLVGYRASDLPSLRKLQQFDQIMTANGLWGHLAVDQVRRNLKSGKLKLSPLAVHDTTHHEAWSTMEIPEIEGKTKKGKPVRKSHPRITKSCRCKPWQDCPHDWVSADVGAGTVVKTGRKMYWAHKASIIALVVGDIEIPLDAAAMTDGATHDSRSLPAHLQRIRTLYPVVLENIEILLDDSALDGKKLRPKIKEEFGIDLRVERNFRRRKAIVDDLPRGIDRILPRGTPVCRAGFPFDLVGVRNDMKHFLFSAPDGEGGAPACTGCTLRDGCIRTGAERRHLSIPFKRLPFLDPELPHLSKRFQQQMANRTMIERINKLMKFDYGSHRLTKRGTAAYQATLDKTVLAMHVVLASG
jgi:hypothetical protein